MAVILCSQCQSRIPEGTDCCPNCGTDVPKAAPVSGVPAMAGAAIFVVVLLACEWFHLFWPAAIAGVSLIALLVIKYGKLAYVAPQPPVAKIEAEVPVGELLEKVEVPETQSEPVCSHCGSERGEGMKFCGNCGQPFEN